MNTKCSACSRTVWKERYCVYHGQALKKLKEHYNKWLKAYGKISWNDYLNKLLYMEETGIWIKEVILAELRN